MRGRDQRSSTLTTGSARLTARRTSLRAIDPLRMTPGNQGSGRRIPICTASMISIKAEMVGIGGGIGKQFGRPSNTTRIAKDRSLNMARMSRKVTRSSGSDASKTRTWDKRI